MNQRLSEYFKYNINSFKVTGIWIDLMNLKGSSYPKILYSFFVNTLFILAPQICHVIYMYKARDNVEAFADEFYVSISSLTVVFKSSSMIRHFGIIFNVVNSMDDDIFQPKNERQWKRTKEIMGAWRGIYRASTFFTFSFCLLYLLSPIVDFFLNGTKLLPLVDCYPFPIFVSPNYEIMYLYQSLLLFCLCWQSYNVNTFISGLLMFAASQCEILCDNLENLKMGKGLGDEEDKRMYKELVSCIEHYDKICRLIEDVNFCFSWNILQQFCSSLITFCTTMFKISMTEPMSKEFVTTICYQGACFLDLFVFCWAGSVLTEKIVKSSFSYFTMLNTLNEK